METAILKDAAGEEVGRRNHPDIPGVKRIRIFLKKASKILAGTARNAYSFRVYGLGSLIKVCEPLGDLAS